jgi:hypothetical protein
MLLSIISNPTYSVTDESGVAHGLLQNVWISHFPSPSIGRLIGWECTDMEFGGCA